MFHVAYFGSLWVYLIIGAVLYIPSITEAQMTPPIWETSFGSELTELTGEDDHQIGVTLSFNFPFAGTNYQDVYVGTNGGLQLGSLGDDGDIDYDDWAYMDEFISDSAPAIFPFNSDLDLDSNGMVLFNDFGDRAVFTWDEVGTYENEDALLSFQVQLIDDGTIIFGYNGILDDAAEDLVLDLDQGIIVGISLGDVTADFVADDFTNGENFGAEGFVPQGVVVVDPGPINFTADTPFSGGTTIYELWCYDEADSCDGGRSGETNDQFDLDFQNIIFTPDGTAGFNASLTTVIPEPSTYYLLATGMILVFLTRRKKGH